MYPYLFEKTPFEVASWEFFLFLGVVVVMLWILAARPKGFPLTRPGMAACVALITVSGLLGAKFLFMILHWPTLMRRHYDLFELIMYSGYAFLGALIFEILAVFAFTKLRRKRVSFFKVADFAAPFMVLQLAFVRVGCFVNGCCYGDPTDLPWGCPSRLAPPGLHHPTQLYSVAALIINFAVMRYIYKKGAPMGVTLFGSLFLYGFFRFFIEFFRADNTPVYGIITSAHIALAGLCAVSITAMGIILFLNQQGGAGKV